MVSDGTELTFFMASGVTVEIFRLLYSVFLFDWRDNTKMNKVSRNKIISHTTKSFQNNRKKKL